MFSLLKSLNKLVDKLFNLLDASPVWPVCAHGFRYKAKLGSVVTQIAFYFGCVMFVTLGVIFLAIHCFFGFLLPLLFGPNLPSMGSILSGIFHAWFSPLSFYLSISAGVAFGVFMFAPILYLAIRAATHMRKDIPAFRNKDYLSFAFADQLVTDVHENGCLFLYHQHMEFYHLPENKQIAMVSIDFKNVISIEHRASKFRLTHTFTIKTDDQTYVFAVCDPAFFQSAMDSMPLINRSIPLNPLEENI